LVDNNTAAFIFEPLIQGASGMRFMKVALLEEMLKIAKSKGVLCIADEVFTGFGRTGKLFATEYLQTQPDIWCLSKGLTGGYMPMGVTACKWEVFSAFTSTDYHKTFFHGHSYTGNPLACAVALASLELLQAEECQQQLLWIQRQNKQFQGRIIGHPLVESIRVLGTILAINFKTGLTEGYFNEARHFLYRYFLSKNVLLRPLGNVIYIVPPYCSSSASLTLAYNAIRDLLYSGELQKLEKEYKEKHATETVS
jgi:adenosylmethionine-8-amino-7-oxononanoate aminotransferase